MADNYVSRARMITRKAYSEEKEKNAHRIEMMQPVSDPNTSSDEDNKAVEAKKIQEKISAMHNINIDLSDDEIESIQNALESSSDDGNLISNKIMQSQIK